MLFLHDANKCKNDRNLLDFEQSIYISRNTTGISTANHA
jgi:hypothetical protein